MKRLFAISMVAIVAFGLNASAQEASPLRLVKTVTLPGVQGRIDHMALDATGQRLFIAALGNNTLEVVDLKKGERIRSITGLSEPQGVAYIPESNTILVSNRGDGTCKLFNADTYELISTINLSDDADNVRYYPGLRHVYVGYGQGGISMIDPSNGRIIGDAKVSAHPEAFEVEHSGRRFT